MRLAIGALVALMASVAPAEAIWVDLTPEQLQEAIAHGKVSYERWRGAGRAIDDLDPEYVVELDPDVGRAMLFTEFSTLALETRRWLAINRRLTPRDVQRLLARVRGRLLFSVTVVGPDRNFLRQYRVHLSQGSARKQPASWNVFRGTPAPDFPSRFIAHAQYTFSVEGLDPSVPVTLVLRGPDSAELRFDFDLSRLR
ncbi:MAG: hypothetical protein ACE5JN_05035 [Candidatus Methylomirabilia bacterium]